MIYCRRNLTPKHEAIIYISTNKSQTINNNNLMDMKCFILKCFNVIYFSIVFVIWKNK